jgi:hypothetical protein
MTANPHSFRKTLALLGGQVCKSPEEYKAWSQNLGHEHVLTTFSSYGDVGRHRQAESFVRSVMPDITWPSSCKSFPLCPCSPTTPHAKLSAMHLSPRCLARTRDGTPCQSSGMPNWRRQMHAGNAPPVEPKGNSHALRHGRYTAEGAS